MTNNLVLLLMIATFSMEDENAKSSWERRFEQLFEEQAYANKKIDSIFAHLQEQEKDNQQKSEEIQVLKKFIFQNVSPSSCPNSEKEILNQIYDRQTRPKLIHQLEENAHDRDFITDEPANVKTNLIEKNEPIEFKEPEMFQNINPDREINVFIEEPEKCTICLEIIENDKEKLTAECKHLYHYGCIQRWLEEHQDCPICRQKICWSQVWIPSVDFRKTTKRAPFPLKQMNDHVNRVNRAQNFELQQRGDHENQRNQIQSHAPYFQQNRRNQQDLLPIGPEQNQNRNALLADQAQNAQNQLQITNWRRKLCLLYSLFSILEVFIVVSGVYVPAWHIWFIAMEIFSVVVFASIIIFHKLGPLNDDFSFPFVTWLLNFALTYHSVTGVLLWGNNLSLASFFPWFAGAFFVAILGNPSFFLDETRNPSRKEYILPGIFWVFIEIMIVCGKLLVSKWMNVFGWMQGFHIASLIMFLVAVFDPNRSKKWWNLQGTWAFSVIVGLLTYISIGALGLSGVYQGHYFLWPFILSVFNSWPLLYENDCDRHPSLLAQGISYFFWILVQIAIVCAKIYVTKWAVWYEFMQGLHLLSFLWYLFPVLKCTERIERWGSYFFLQATVFHIGTLILSYHSITGFLLSDGSLACATLSPWAVVVIGALACYLNID